MHLIPMQENNKVKGIFAFFPTIVYFFKMQCFIIGNCDFKILPFATAINLNDQN